MNLPTIEELRSLLIQAGIEEEECSQRMYVNISMVRRLAEAARLAVEGQERAMIVAWLREKMQEHGRIAETSLDEDKALRNAGAFHSLKDAADAIYARAHMIELDEPTESEAGK